MIQFLKITQIYIRKTNRKSVAFSRYFHNNKTLQTSVFHKKTCTGILLNCFSFLPGSYKYRLIKTLIDRMYRINKTWASFDVDLKNLKQFLLKPC